MTARAMTCAHEWRNRSNALGIFGRDEAKRKLAFGRKRIIGANQPSVDLGGQRGLGQPCTNFRGNVDGPHAPRIL